MDLVRSSTSGRRVYADLAVTRSWHAERRGMMPSGAPARYLRTMAERRVRPIKHDPALDEYAGEWVAVKDGEVIAHSADSRGVVRQLRTRPDGGQGAVVHRVATSAEPLAVGLG